MNAATSNRAHGDFSYPFGLLSCWDLSLWPQEDWPKRRWTIYENTGPQLHGCVPLRGFGVLAGTIDSMWSGGATGDLEHVGEIGALNGAPLEQPRLDIYNVNIPSPSAVTVAWSVEFSIQIFDLGCWRNSFSPERGTLLTLKRRQHSRWAFADWAWTAICRHWGSLHGFATGVPRRPRARARSNRWAAHRSRGETVHRSAAASRFMRLGRQAAPGSTDRLESRRARGRCSIKQPRALP